MKTSLSNFVEKAVAGIVVPICIFIAVFDLFGWLDTDSTFTNIVSNLPSISLILLSGLTAYLVFVYPEKDSTRHSELLDHANKIEASIKGMDLLGGRVKGFQDFDECLKYTRHRILFAKMSALSLYSDLNLNLFKSSQSNIMYREILFANSISDPALQPHFQLRKNSGIQNYKCAVFEPRDGVYHQFVVIDSEEVIFLSTISSNNIAVAHPKIVDLLQLYFDEIDRIATKIK